MAMAIPGILKLRRAKHLAATDPYQFKASGQLRVHPPPAPNALEAYVLGDVSDDRPDIMVFSHDLGGSIKQENLPERELPAQPGLLAAQWQGFTIDVFEVREQISGRTLISYNAQIPVVPNAIQLSVAGLEERQEEMQAILTESLAGIAGTANWQ